MTPIRRLAVIAVTAVSPAASRSRAAVARRDHGPTPRPGSYRCRETPPARSSCPRPERSGSASRLHRQRGAGAKILIPYSAARLRPQRARVRVHEHRAAHLHRGAGHGRPHQRQRGLPEQRADARRAGRHASAPRSCSECRPECLRRHERRARRSGWGRPRGVSRAVHHRQQPALPLPGGRGRRRADVLRSADARHGRRSTCSRSSRRSPSRSRRSARGSLPAEVQSLVTVPLENALQGVPGVDEVESESVPELSAIFLYFKGATDVLQARQLVQERLATAASTLPSWASPPAMYPIVSATSRVLQIGLTSRTLSPLDLSTIASYKIRPQAAARSGRRQRRDLGKPDQGHRGPGRPVANGRQPGLAEPADGRRRRRRRRRPAHLHERQRDRDRRLSRDPQPAPERPQHPGDHDPAAAGEGAGRAARARGRSPSETWPACRTARRR